ncbi:MAG: heme biosynthesis protein HemY, partial [Lysobacterales bacterium]
GLGQWQAMQEILPVMQKAGLIDVPRAQILQSQAAVSQISLCKDQEQLQRTWMSFPRAMQKSAEIIRPFAERAARLGAGDLNEPIIRASLKKTWDTSLLIPYGDPAAADANQRMKQCEKWLQDHPDDANLHLALGRLCGREELWGKARYHMIRSLELGPTAAGYDSLGQLLEHQGELELAMASFRNALRMSQGDKPLPLPGNLMRLVAPDSTAV